MMDALRRSHVYPLLAELATTWCFRDTPDSSPAERLRPDPLVDSAYVPPNPIVIPHGTTDKDILGLAVDFLIDIPPSSPPRHRPARLRPRKRLVSLSYWYGRPAGLPVTTELLSRLQAQDSFRPKRTPALTLVYSTPPRLSPHCLPAPGCPFGLDFQTPGRPRRSFDMGSAFCRAFCARPPVPRKTPPKTLAALAKAPTPLPKLARTPFQVRHHSPSANLSSSASAGPSSCATSPRLSASTRKWKHH